MRRLQCLKCLVAFSFLILAERALAPCAWAQPTGDREPEIKPLVVTSAAEPVPALRYSMWRGPSERKPGNAASFYYRALLLMQSTPRERGFGELQKEWMEAPLDAFPVAEAKEWLRQHRQSLDELATAVRRERCDWDLQVEQLRGPEIIAFLLPEVQEARELARVLQVEARTALAEGRFDDVLATLRDGYQLAVDINEAPFLINSLVGIAIASIMNERMLELIDESGSPNLYWAIASLPSPLIDMREALLHEMSAPRRYFPFLDAPESAEHSTEEWRRLIVDAYADTLLQSLASGGAYSHIYEFQAATLVIRNYPEAKRRLIARGFAPDRVEQMPVGQVIAIEVGHEYDYISQDIFKWLLLPSQDYGEIDKRLFASEERLRTEGYLAPFPQNREILPVASLLMPAFGAAKRAERRLVRELAGLQVIEALRMHAAANDGRLPNSLDEVRIVPVPNDPFTGEPFGYRLEGDQGRLDMSSPIPGPPALGRIHLISVE